MENQPKRGRLKIFLGYADGVGKTYTMLRAAHQRLAEGSRVAVAWIDPCCLGETSAMLEGLEIVPPHPIPGAHGGAEIDVDAILAAKPDLVVVDDLAQSNPPGARHPRHYHEVEDLLAGGISVYSTLNIQNMESLKDVVFQITGVQVEESVPDSLFDQASIIELVDLEPDELITRFQAGKVNVSSSLADRAEQFYRPGNLIALRELSMRRAAGRIDDQMQAYMAARAIRGPWAASETLMVCISAHPMGERLVRAGHRLARSLSASWYAVYVETPDRLAGPERYQAQVLNTLRLAEELGATVVRLSGRTITETLLDFAASHNVTKLVVGKPLRPRWQELFGGSLIDDIIRESKAIDVYVISDERPAIGARLPHFLRPRGSLAGYLAAPLLVAGATLLGLPLDGLIHPANLVMLYLVAVVISAVFAGRGPSMLASFLSVLAYDFFFIHPTFSLSVSDTQYLITFFGLLTVGLVISYLSGMVRDQVTVLRRREEQTTTLYHLSRELTTLVDPNAILNTVIQHIAQTFSRESTVLLPRDGRLEVRAASQGLILSQPDLDAAGWAFEHGQAAGRGTNTFPEVSLHYQPLRTPRGITGVLGVRPTGMGRLLSPEQREFLNAYASLAALAIERAYLADQATQAQLTLATEKLQTALLNSISHDLRTPLATITGVFSSLAEAEEAAGQVTPTEKPGGHAVQPQAAETPAFQGGEGALDYASRRELIETGWEEAQRLNRLVGNLLDITRLEAGALKLRLQSGDVVDVVGAALGRLRDRLQGRPLETLIPPGLPWVMMDFVLIEQVMVNLLDNALKYSPPGSPLTISAQRAGQTVEISVADRGSGIPPADLDKLFSKFFRSQSTAGKGRQKVGGTGLGLSICKGIVEAHGGHIRAENRPGGGTLFCFTLPAAEEDRPGPEAKGESNQEGRKE